MSDAPTVLAPIELAAYREAMGRAALNLRTRPRPTLTIIAGGRRMLGEKSERPPVDLKLVEKESQ